MKIKKNCSRCKQLLPFDCFYKNKSKKHGLESCCKGCTKQYNKQYYHNHKEENSKRGKEYRRSHKEELIEYDKQRYPNRRERVLEQKRRHYSALSQERKEEITKRKKQRYQDDRERILEQKRQYAQSHKKEIAEKNKKYNQNHKEKINGYRNRKYKESPKFRLNIMIGRAICRALKIKNISKANRHWESLVNFTLEELINHLESLFHTGMTWENQGKWHIDHIKPISLFDFKGVDDPEFKKCWSLENLQPLWAEENIKKSNKY